MAMNVTIERAHLTVIWYDRCQRVVNTNDEQVHFHLEQYGGCRKSQKIDAKP